MKRWLTMLVGLGLATPGGAQPLPETERSRLIAEYRSGRVTDAERLASVARALIYRGRDDPRLFHDALAVYDRAIAADPDNHDLRVELGDFFLSKYNGQDARETYDQVLASAPDHPGALLGLARVRRFDGATDVFDLTQKVLEKEPDHPGARLLQARQYLDLEDHAAADREAERALARIPPGPPFPKGGTGIRVQAQALLAASALLRGDRALTARRFAHLDQSAETARGGHIAMAEAFVTLSEVAARNRLYERAVDFADRAFEIDARSWRALALRGINRLRIGEIDSGRQDLEKAFAGDPFDVWTKNTLDLLDAMEAFQRIDTGRFQLVMPSQEADLLALYLGPLAEEAFDRLEALYGQAPPTPIRLEVFPRHADFSVRTIGLAGLGALGVCFGPVIALDAPSAMAAGEIHWGTVLWHELAHSFHMHASGGRVPRWFTEGLAVFEERRARAGWGDRVDPDYLIAYKAGRLAPIEDLNQGFMRPAYPQQIAFSYLQASLLFDFIVERWGEGTEVVMLSAYRDGGNTPGVVRSVLGLELEELAAAYDADFRRRFAGPLAAIRVPDEDAVSGLEEMVRRAERDPDDFLAQLVAGRSLVAADPPTALRYLERARGLFPDHAGADSPYWWLAELHRRAGRPEKAAVELEELIARNPAHYPALRAMVEVYDELGDRPGAVRALEAAQYVYPYHEDDHRRLAEWYLDAGRPTDAVRERQAVLALRPADRARALYHLAGAHAAAGDVATARGAVLEALEQAPSYEEALELLLELREHREEKR